MEPQPNVEKSSNWRIIETRRLNAGDMTKHVVFDIVGTLVCFDAFYNRINEVIGEKLRSHGVPAQLFGFAWMTQAELEFTFLSISSRHTSYKDVMKAMFYRTLWMSGIQEPRKFATDEERDKCQEGYSLLGLREGAKECIETLRSNGFNVWCLTTAGEAISLGIFSMS